MRKLTGLLLFLTLLPFSLHGQETGTLQLPEQGDVRIIVDISGSMKKNDPKNLRQPAVRLLARMLPGGAEAGVWTFGKWVNMLVPHGEVTDNWRQQAVRRSDSINSVALRTNLGEALEVASSSYLSGNGLNNTDFILLTDGKVDLSDSDAENAKERARILGPLLDDLVARGATLHTVALSEDADLELLRALSERSSGHYSLASTAEELNRAFLEALNAAVPQEQIPLDEEGFSVDSGVEEFTALIFWGEDETSATRELELVSPEGDASDKDTPAGNMRWAAETGYDLITVTGPEAGQWTINGELGEGSRVTVVSDLRMVVSPVPPTFTSDEPIDLKVAFFEEKSRIENPDFLNVIDVQLKLTASSGRSGSKTLSPGKPPEDGVYFDHISSLPAPGDYDIEVIADGKTFSRSFSGVTRYVVPDSFSMMPEEDESSEPVAEPKPEPEPEPDVVEPQPDAVEPQIAAPIDVSQVEEPSEAPAETSEPETADEQGAGIPVWVWALSGGVFLLLIPGGVWFWLKKRKSAEDDEDEPPVMAPEEVPELEPEPEKAEEPEETPEEPDDADQPESEPEREEDASEDAEAFGEETDESDKTDESPEGVDEASVDEESPEEEAKVEKEAPEQPSEEMPEESGEEESSSEDDDDEFGLEDFDLSEFDDLPDDEDSDEKDSEKEQSDDKGDKKEEDEPKKDGG